ncbi:MAG: AAA family ATPase, partial [Candidatus Omnitrophota bacterium]
MSTPLFEVSAVALGKIGDTEALPYLLTYADSTSRPLETLERRDAAKAGLQEMLSSKDTDVLKRLLHHSDYSIKAEEALAKIIQETTDTEELIKLISSEEIIAHTYTKEDLGPRTKLRFMLLDKLKGVNDERLARPFLKIFSPEELYQRLSSNGKYLIIVRDVLFNMIQTTNDTDFLLECLKRALVDGSAEKMGNAAAERLGQIKDPETVIPLTRHLFMTFPYAPHPSLEKHRCATSIVNALGELCDPRAMDALSRVLSSTYSRPGNLSAQFEAHIFDFETRIAAEKALTTIKAVKIDSKVRLPKVEVKSEGFSRLGVALKKVGRWLWENRKRIFICLLIVALLVAANYMLPDIPGKSSLGGIPFFPIAGSVAVADDEEKAIARQMVTLHRRMVTLSKKKTLGKEKLQPYEFTRRNRRKWSEFIKHYKNSMGLTKAFIKGAYYIYRDRLETDLDRKIFMKELRKLDLTSLMKIDREQRGIRVVLEDLFNGRADEEIKRSLKKAKNLKISEFFSREDGKIRVVDSLLTINDREEDKSDVPEKEASDLMAILKTVKDLEKVVQAIEVADPVLLVGETGVGKTSLIRALAYLSNNNFRRFNLNGQTDKLEFIGGYRPKSKTLSDEEAASLLLETLAQVKLKDPREAKRLVKAIKLVCGEKEMTID